MKVQEVLENYNSLKASITIVKGEIHYESYKSRKLKESL